MGSRSQEAWNEVAERFSSWGRHVGDRYKGTASGATDAAQESQRKLEEAAREIADQLNRAFTALGDTLRDDQAKTELKDAVRSLGDAVAVTVTETGEAIRRRVATAGEGDDEQPGGNGSTA